MRRASQPLVAYAVAVVAIALSAVLLPSELAAVAVPVAFALASAVTVAVHVRRYRPAAPEPWYHVCAGLIVLALADLGRGFEKLEHTQLPRPSIIDALTLVAYLLFIGAVMSFMRDRVLGNRRARLLDGLLAASAAAMLGWTFLVRPTIELTNIPTADVVSAILYPIASLVLLGAAAQLWKDKNGEQNVWARTFVLAMIVLVATNVAYGFSVLADLGNNAPGVNASIVAGWCVFFVLIGVSACHPSMALPPQVTSDEINAPPWKRFAILIAIAGSAPLLVALGDYAQHRGPDFVTLVVGDAVMIALIVMRMYDIQRDLRGALLRERSLRDANARLVAALDLREVREVLVDTTAELFARRLCRVWLVEEPVAAGFVRPVGSDGPVHIVSGDNDLRTTLDLRADEVLVVAELPTRSDGDLALVAAANRRPTREMLWAVDALVHAAALAVDRVHLGELVVARQSEERLQRLLRDASDVVAVIDRRFVIRYVTPAVERVLGRAPQDLTGTNWLDYVLEDDRDTAKAMIVRSNEGWPGRGEFQLIAGDGGTRHMDVAVSVVSDADGGGYTVACHDVTRRHDLEEQLTHQAFHDTLTGLANRALFQNRLRHAVDRSRRTGDRFAVLFVDLDDFKTVNDSLGHAAGDTVLRTVGSRLRATLRHQDTAARLGGDEFAVILEDVADEREATDIAARLVEELAAPVRLGGAEVPLGASVGVAHGGSATDDPDELMRNADLALYDAKGSGKGQHAVFAPVMHETALDRLQLKAELRRALNQNEFVVQYQPLRHLGVDAEVVGVEALVRWTHPTRGTLPPAQFVGLAEETGLIVPLGRSVLEQALKAAARWHRTPGYEQLMVAVNVSARQLLDHRIVDDVRDALDAAGIDPTTLVLEITESVLLPDGGVTAERLNQLVALGVRLYIDDFGTGYSSLAYLRDLPVSGIKLAREFVDALPGTETESGLVRTIHALAHTLGLDHVVAEGVETEKQRRALYDLGYRVGQGFHLGRPTDADGISALLTGIATDTATGPATGAAAADLDDVAAALHA